ncbi:hypothetical protein ACOMHN_015433 [Nucella lapillus]
MHDAVTGDQHDRERTRCTTHPADSRTSSMNARCCYWRSTRQRKDTVYYTPSRQPDLFDECTMLLLEINTTEKGHGVLHTQQTAGPLR